MSGKRLVLGSSRKSAVEQAQWLHLVTCQAAQVRQAVAGRRTLIKGLSMATGGWAAFLVPEEESSNRHRNAGGVLSGLVCFGNTSLASPPSLGSTQR